MNVLIVRASEAAKMLATSQKRLLELLEAGEIPAYRDGKNWSIPVRTLEEYVITRAKEESKQRKENNEQ